MNEDRLRKITISLAAGIFIGTAVFDIFPAARIQLGIAGAITWMSIGLFLWWLQKSTLHHLKKPDMPPLVASALWFHSVLEGVVTGLSFGVSQPLGLLVLGAMVLHLLPEFFAAIALMQGAGSAKQTSVWVTLTGFVILFVSFGLTYRFLPDFGSALIIAIALSGGTFLYIGIVSFWRKLGLQTTIACAVGILLALLFQ